MKLPDDVLPMPSEQRAELKRLATVLTGHHYGASDPYWRKYRAIATPANALATLAYLEALEAALTTIEAERDSLKQELAASQAQAERWHEGFIEWESVAKSFEKAMIEAGLLPQDATPAPPQAQEAGAEPWRAVFDTQEEYDASVADVCRRIESGEITPRQVELNSLHRCPLCDESPCGMCPEHASRRENEDGGAPLVGRGEVAGG